MNSRKNNVHPKSAKAGFTLVEVMMASGVMILCIVGMIQVISSGAAMLDLSRKQTIATQIMHGEIENVRLRNWTQVTALPTSSTAVTINSSFQTISTGFQCTRNISTVKTDLKKVTFTVTWKGITGRSYSRSSSMYFGKNGLYVAYQRS